MMITARAVRRSFAPPIAVAAPVSVPVSTCAEFRFLALRWLLLLLLLLLLILLLFVAGVAAASRSCGNGSGRHMRCGRRSLSDHRLARGFPFLLIPLLLLMHLLVLCVAGVAAATHRRRRNGSGGGGRRRSIAGHREIISAGRVARG